MIALLFQSLFDIIISLINILLAPIDLIIQAALPQVAQLLGYVNAMLDVGINGLAYAISLTMISPLLVEIIYDYIFFVLTVPIAIRSIKLVIRWYNALKP